MTENSSGYTKVNNKQIAKNAIYLYLRMFITMWVTLYTSRFLLNVLGVEDYGIYNIVGGITILFTFIGSSLLLSSERYIASSIAGYSSQRIKQIFSTCINCHLFIAFILFLLSETIGLWIINTQLVLPAERLLAANCVYQASVISCVINVINSPYHACVVAYERFGFNALEGIVLTFLKLCILILVYFSTWDSLIYYATLYCLVNLLQIIMNLSYCYYHFNDIRYVTYWNKELFFSIFRFAGLNMLKNGAFVSFNQGTNIGFNIFGGVVINAALGVANQVYAACLSFMHAVQSAFYPQIIRTCAAKEYQDTNSLTRRAAKFSFLMLLFIGCPFILNMNFVLNIWLGKVPPYAIEFSIIILFACFLDAIIEPLNTAMMAYGKIRNYVLLNSTVWFASCMLIFITLAIGEKFYICLLFRIFAQLLIVLISCIFLKKHINFPYSLFFKNDCIPLCIILISGLFIPHLLISLIKFNPFVEICFSILISWIVIGLLIYLIGLNQSEKEYLIKFILTKFLTK